MVSYKVLDICDGYLPCQYTPYGIAAIAVCGIGQILINGIADRQDLFVNIVKASAGQAMIADKRHLARRNLDFKSRAPVRLVLLQVLVNVGQDFAAMQVHNQLVKIVSIAGIVLKQFVGGSDNRAAGDAVFFYVFRPCGVKAAWAFA